jgi:hypothetical protein
MKENLRQRLSSATPYEWEEFDYSDWRTVYKDEDGDITVLVSPEDGYLVLVEEGVSISVSRG